MPGIKSTAVAEMYRLKGAHGWSPLSKVTRKRNQYSSIYTFADGSKLVVFINGDAAYDEGNGDGLQRWQRWHRCNDMGC